MRLSLKTGGCYPEFIDYPELPDDIVTITDDEHNAYVNREHGSTVTYEDGVLIITPPPPIPQAVLLDNARGRAFAIVKDKHAKFLAQLTGSTTNEERDTWPEKVNAARESMSIGIPTPEATALFNAEAVALNQTVMERCQKCLTLRNAFLAVTGAASGFKTKIELLIKNATSVVELEKIMAQASIDVQVEVNKYLTMLGK